MRSVLLLAITSMFVLPFAACGSDNGPDADPFDTFQACYDEHHTEEMFDTQKAIKICCLDHPIGGAKANVVCGESASACETYVGANLMDANDTMLSADITAACEGYITDRSK